jgi:hypothetical protein
LKYKSKNHEKMATKEIKPTAWLGNMTFDQVSNATFVVTTWSKNKKSGKNLSIDAGDKLIRQAQDGRWIVELKAETAVAEPEHVQG